MSQNSSPQNVPSATQGEAVSVAAPGLVGAGGTLSPEAEATCDWLENDWDSFADAVFGKVGGLS